MTDPTIQTPVGPGSDATGDIVVSLSEIDAMVRKAARGAGYSWGMAEEAGRAVRWLAAQGVDGVSLIAELFDSVDGRVADFVPDVGAPVWKATSGRLCPISAGAALSDRAEVLDQVSSVHLDDTMSPVLMSPFLVSVARRQARAVQLAAGEVSVVVCADGPMDSELAELARTGCAMVVISILDAPRGESRNASVRGVPVDVQDWRRLDRYAARTYVPATEQSRRSGAGAGTTDND